MSSTPAANYMYDGDASLAYLVNLVIRDTIAKSLNEAAFVPASFLEENYGS